MASAKPRLLVVGGGLFQLDIIETAQSAGIEVAVVDRNAQAPGLLRADHARVIDTTDLDAVLATARELEVQAVVTAASDVAVGAVARVVDALGLPGIGSAVAQRGRDKLKTFEALREAGLRSPMTIAVGDADEARDQLEPLGGYPIVVKPRSAAGGRGVCIVEQDGDLESAIERARVHAGSDREVLVQAFARGLSVGAEAFFYQDTLVAAFVLDDQYEAGFVSPVGHSLPCALSPERQAVVRDAIEAYARALGLAHGPANFDLRIDEEDDVSLIEVNMRLGGNSITDLVRLALGVDLSLATVRAAFGETPHALLAAAARPKAIATRLIVKRGSGIANIGPQVMALRSRDDVLSIDLSVEHGERAPLRVDEHVLLGRCVTRGRTPQEAVELAEAIARSVTEQIELTP